MYFIKINEDSVYKNQREIYENELLLEETFHRMQIDKKLTISSNIADYVVYEIVKIK